MFDTLLVFFEDFFEKVDFEKKSVDDKKNNMKNYSRQRVKKYSINCPGGHVKYRYIMIQV